MVEIFVFSLYTWGFVVLEKARVVLKLIWNFDSAYHAEFISN